MIKDRVLAMIGGGLSILLAAALAYVWITSGATIREVRGQLTTARAEASATEARRAADRILAATPRRRW